MNVCHIAIFIPLTSAAHFVSLSLSKTSLLFILRQALDDSAWGLMIYQRQLVQNVFFINLAFLKTKDK